MTKFNEIQKKRRAQSQEKKRLVHGDPMTRKLKNKPQPQSISGKRKRKLFKKWRMEQKNLLQKGVVTMGDVEMALAEGTSEDTKKTSKKFHLKKNAKLKIKSKSKAKKQKRSPAPVVEAPVDVMME
ncbi:uncharacterized protein LOC122075807 [Macadamia integrifolia]|uniref:uncharacterized protein LOC122075807 n=1 Tax=Macadamia integrifolia TaxID=60698 RepID=UPI001C4FA280|nr:uncharacterized protein LOC122075807 [Macadamia integrifolia]